MTPVLRLCSRCESLFHNGLSLFPVGPAAHNSEGFKALSNTGYAVISFVQTFCFLLGRKNMQTSCKSQIREEFALLLFVLLILLWTLIRGRLTTGYVSESVSERSVHVWRLYRFKCTVIIWSRPCITLEPLEQISYDPVTAEDADLVTFLSRPQRFLNWSLFLLGEFPCPL